MTQSRRRNAILIAIAVVTSIAAIAIITSYQFTRGVDRITKRYRIEIINDSSEDVLIRRTTESGTAQVTIRTGEKKLIDENDRIMRDVRHLAQSAGQYIVFDVLNVNGDKIGSFEVLPTSILSSEFDYIQQLCISNVKDRILRIDDSTQHTPPC